MDNSKTQAMLGIRQKKKEGKKREKYDPTKRA
jgi:hypothetical protein